MQPDPILVKFIEARRRFFEELEFAKGRLDKLLNELLEREPTIFDLARLEGLHAEKHRLFTDFVRTEDALVGQLLDAKRKAVSEQSSSSSGPPNPA